MIRLMPFKGRPPPRIRSSPSSPLVPRSSISALSSPAASDQRARSEQVLDGRDELERIKRLLQKGVSARGQRLVSSLQDGNGEHCPSIVLLFKRRHSSAPRPPEIISSTIASCGRLSSHCSSASPTAKARCTSYPSVRRKNCARSAATGSRSASSTSSRVAPFRSSFAKGWPLFALLGQQPVSVGRRQAPRNLRRDEAQLLHLVARIEAVSPRAAFRDDRPVALLPVADRRGRNPQHPRHRTDAVDAATPASFIRHAAMLTDREDSASS